MEALALSYSYDVIDISETWWDEFHDWTDGMECSRLFRRNKQGKWGEGVALYIRERLDGTALSVRDVVVEILWVRIKRMGSKADVDVYYQPLVVLKVEVTGNDAHFIIRSLIPFREKKYHNYSLTNNVMQL